MVTEMKKQHRARMAALTIARFMGLPKFHIIPKYEYRRERWYKPKKRKLVAFWIIDETMTIAIATVKV